MKRFFLLFVLGQILIFFIGGQTAFSQSDFTAYPNNPVLGYGPSGSWDAGVIYLPEVVLKDNLYYMFYNASENLMTTPMSVGYATSSDGITWTKYGANPVFQGDGTGFDAFSSAESALLIENDTWVLYYNAHSVPGPGPGPAIGRATALDPSGPWTTLDNPVLEVGSPGEWDAGFVGPNTIIANDSGYIMYYSGGTGFPFPPSNHAMVGAATSPDGINWTKYDDPSTTAPPFAESDPVLPLGEPGSYDSGVAWECDVLKTENGWEMFYTSVPDNWDSGHISYATSDDGIHWTKYDNNPFFVDTKDWIQHGPFTPSVVKINGTYYMYYVGNTTPLNGQIGLATGTTVTDVSIAERTAIARTFELFQNYPNPFNPSTAIVYSITNPNFVTLKVYDLLGREIKTLVSEFTNAGTHSVIFDASKFASGVYFYTLQIGNFVETRKMLLME